MHRVLPYDVKKLQVRCDCEVVEDSPVCEVRFFFLSPEKGSSKSEIIRGLSRGQVDPWKQFQLYAFTLEGPVCICGDTNVFRFLMSAFNQFEVEVGYCK